MKLTLKRKKETNHTAGPIVEPIVVNGISELSTDFGREDLNLLAAKLNEVIRKINK